MRNFIIKSFIIPIPGIVFYWSMMRNDLWIYVYVIYVFLMIPSWITLSNIKLILDVKWKKLIWICLLLCFAEYLYAFSWPIGALLLGNTSGAKMVCQLILFIGTIVNIIMTFIILTVKLSVKRTVLLRHNLFHRCNRGKK